MKERNYDILMEVKSKKNENKLLNSLLQLQEEYMDFKRITDDYWSNLNILNEEMRYNKELKEIKEAFQFLLLQALYSRQQITIGEESFIPNVEVAQGSGYPRSSLIYIYIYIYSKQKKNVTPSFS